MSDTNLIRRTERRGTEAAAAATVLMEAELGYLTDTKQLIAGDGQRVGGYKLTPDNIVAVWPNQADADSPLSLAWWITRANGGSIQLRLPAGTYTVAADLTVPANVYLDVDKGAVFNIASGKTLTLNCEIGADAQPEFSGDGTAVENYIRRLHINENLISHRRHRWSAGSILRTTGEVDASENTRFSFLHSDYFSIEAEKKYTFKSHGPCLGRLLFYNASKEYISSLSPKLATLQRKEGYTFNAPAGAAYVRISSSMRKADGSDDGELLHSNITGLGFKHLYKLEEGPYATSFSIAPCDMQDPAPIQPNEMPKNDQEAARQLVACAESYKGKGWVYGQVQSRNDTYTDEGPDATTLYDENDVKQIDCQTLMVLALSGIQYYQSKYFNSSFPWRNVHYYPWGKYPNHLYLEGFALWCYQNGWEVDPGINYSKLQAGDLVFYGKADYPVDSDDAWRLQFRYIDHVGMFTGRWVADANRNNELHPQSIEVLQDDPVVTNNFIDRISSSGKEIKMIIRMPLETPYGEFDSDVNTDGVFYSSYYKPSVSVIGNGEPVKIDIYGRNFAVWEIGSNTGGEESVSSTRLRTGYMPRGSTVKNTAALTTAGYTLGSYYYYDADLNYLGTSQTDDTKYVRIGYRKTNNGVISGNDFADFVKISGVQKYGRDTITGGKYPTGFHSWAYLDTVIPNGARLDRHNGKYAYTTGDGTWTDLPEGDQMKLMSLRVADGENNVYIPNGQKVTLMRQDTVPKNEAIGSGGLYLAFGDSIVHGRLPEGVGLTPTHTNYTYVEAIGRATHIGTTINNAVCGQGLIAVSTSDTNPHKNETALDTVTLYADIIPRATLITLAWGKNDRAYSLGTSADSSTDNTICGKWKALLDYIRSLNSSAQIIIIASIKQSNKDWDEDLGSGNWSLDDLHEQVGAIAAAYNIPYITWEKCGIVNNLQDYVLGTDVLHPTEYAYKRMGAYIAGQVKQYFNNVWEL